MGAKRWISASSAQKCNATTSCVNGQMASGVLQGDTITALAKLFGDASGATATGSQDQTTLDVAAKCTNYNGDSGGTAYILCFERAVPDLLTLFFAPSVQPQRRSPGSPRLQGRAALKSTPMLLQSARKLGCST